MDRTCRGAAFECSGQGSQVRLDVGPGLEGAQKIWHDFRRVHGALEIARDDDELAVGGAVTYGCELHTASISAGARSSTQAADSRDERRRLARGTRVCSAAPGRVGRG